MLSQAAGRIRRASNVERCVASNGPQQVARVECGYRGDAFIHGCDIRRFMYMYIGRSVVVVVVVASAGEL